MVPFYPAFRTVSKKLVKAPNVLGQPRHHGDGRSLLTAFARFAGLPAVVVIGREHGESGFQIAELLREALRQSIQAFQEDALRPIQRLDVAGRCPNERLAIELRQDRGGCL